MSGDQELTRSGADGEALRVAVVGSGPAGIYTADALGKQLGQQVGVDVLDRLPTPYGLVRYGVAPDHPSIKSISRVLREILEHPRVRFLGNVEFGSSVVAADLARCYDAVVYATGAMVDRRLGIEGEDLPGSVAATDFVNWYCGHPDIDMERFVLDSEDVAVIGVGNVAVDVVRVLARSADELSVTDVPVPVLEALRASRVRRLVMVGRRGPAQAKFTSKELRELGRLDGVDITVPAADLALDSTDRAKVEAERATGRNLAVLDEWAQRSLSGASRRIEVSFWRRPVRILGTERVEGVVLERTRLDDDGQIIGTGQYERLPAQMVLRSVGYQSVPLPDVAFDPHSHTVPHQAGRVLDGNGEPDPGTYVAGWLKRGPTGVIGTNKSDAAETVRSITADAPALLHHRDGPRPHLDELLSDRGIDVVSYHDWLDIDATEADLAHHLGRGERVKLTGWHNLLHAAGRPTATGRS